MVDAPPPSSFPPTTRGHRDKSGGLDPYPPNPGAWLRAVAPHAVLVCGLAAVAALARGSAMLLVLPALLVVAAWQAWLLARADARHRPLAIGFGAWAALALVGRALDITVLAEPGPYAGWARAAFHLEEATRLATAAMPAWMAIGVMWRTREWVGKLGLALVFFGLFVVLVFMYLALRGEPLRKFYLGAELASLFVAMVAILSWAGRLWVGYFERGELPPERPMARWYTWAPILALVTGDMLLLGWGAWRWGFFGDAYVVQQAGMFPVWCAVAIIQWIALRGAR